MHIGFVRNSIIDTLKLHYSGTFVSTFISCLCIVSDIPIRLLLSWRIEHRRVGVGSVATMGHQWRQSRHNN